MVQPGIRVAAGVVVAALAGSAFAVQKGTAPQKRCRPGAILGIASVTDRAVHSGQFPRTFSGVAALFDNRFNCTGKAVLVRRVGIGVYEVQFVGNSGNVIVGNVSGNGLGSVGWGRQPDGTFTVYLSQNGPSGAEPVDSAFVVTLL